MREERSYVPVDLGKNRNEKSVHLLTKNRFKRVQEET